MVTWLANNKPVTPICVGTLSVPQGFNFTALLVFLFFWPQHKEDLSGLYGKNVKHR